MSTDTLSGIEVCVFDAYGTLFDVTPARIGFPSSNAWDVAGAASFGFRVVWVNRFTQPPERLPAGADLEVRDLESLPALVMPQ